MDREALDAGFIGFLWEAVNYADSLPGDDQAGRDALVGFIRKLVEGKGVDPDSVVIDERSPVATMVSVLDSIGYKLGVDVSSAVN